MPIKIIGAIRETNLTLNKKTRVSEQTNKEIIKINKKIVKSGRKHLLKWIKGWVSASITFYVIRRFWLRQLRQLG